MQVNTKTGMRRPLDARLFLTDEELDVGITLILGAERRLVAVMNEVVEKSDLTLGDVRLLLAIKGHPGLSVHALRRHMAATTPTLARQLGRLAQADLIRRDATAPDRRARQVFLSEAGEATLAPILETLRNALKLAYRSTGAEAVDGTRALLGALTGDHYG